MNVKENKKSYTKRKFNINIYVTIILSYFHIYIYLTKNQQNFKEIVEQVSLTRSMKTASDFADPIKAP